MHGNETIYTLICIKNHILQCSFSMLSCTIVLAPSPSRALVLYIALSLAPHSYAALPRPCPRPRPPNCRPSCCQSRLLPNRVHAPIARCPPRCRPDAFAANMPPTCCLRRSPTMHVPALNRSNLPDCHPSRHHPHVIAPLRPRPACQSSCTLTTYRPSHRPYCEPTSAQPLSFAPPSHYRPATPAPHLTVALEPPSSRRRPVHPRCCARLPCAALTRAHVMLSGICVIPNLSLPAHAPTPHFIVALEPPSSRHRPVHPRCCARLPCAALTRAHVMPPGICVMPNLSLPAHAPAPSFVPASALLSHLGHVGPMRTQLFCTLFRHPRRRTLLPHTACAMLPHRHSVSALHHLTRACSLLLLTVCVAFKRLPSSQPTRPRALQVRHASPPFNSKSLISYSISRTCFHRLWYLD